MMQYAVKKTFVSPLEHINVEYEQRNLFELTVGKLQKEQLRPGMEPRLLRFVLINNALRTLQCHMMKNEEPPSLTIMENGDENTESFLCNTFKDGGLPLSPQSPPTPIKVKTLGSLLSDLSPLVASTGILDDAADTADFGRLVESVGGVRDEGGGACEPSEEGDTTESNGERTLLRGCLGKRLSSETDFSLPKMKRLCEDIETKSINGVTTPINGVTTPINGVTPLINGTLLPLSGVHTPLELLSPTGHGNNSPLSDTESEDESSTLSPIDFTKVDASLYGYDLSADPSNSPIILPSSSLPLFTPATTNHHSLTSISHTPISTSVSIAAPSSSTNSSSIAVSPHVSSSDTHPASKTTPQTETLCKKNPPPCKNGKFSGSMEGIVSTQNGHLDETSPLASASKLGCSREELTPETDFFEDLVSLLIT